MERTLSLLLGVSFLYLFASSLLIPIFPHLISASFEGDVANDSPETTQRYGTLSILKSSLDLLSLPLLGGLSDYLGRRGILMGCIFSILVQILLVYPPGVGLFGVNNYYAALILSRVLGGVSDGVLVMIFASLTDLCDGDAAKLPVYYGKVGMVFGLAFTLGPMTAATLYGKFNSIEYVLYLSTAGAGGACVICWFLPETLPASKRRVFGPKFYATGAFWLGLTPFDQIMYLTSSPLLVAYILTYFLHETSTAVYMSWILYFEWR